MLFIEENILNSKGWIKLIGIIFKSILNLEHNILVDKGRKILARRIDNMRNFVQNKGCRLGYDVEEIFPVVIPNEAIQRTCRLSCDSRARRH